MGRAEDSGAGKKGIAGSNSSSKPVLTTLTHARGSRAADSERRGIPNVAFEMEQRQAESGKLGGSHASASAKKLEN